MRRRVSERGAVAVFTALILVVTLVAAAFAVDLGTQRVVRSDLQALADAVALDAARLLDGRNAGAIEAGMPSLDDTVKDSFDRNKASVLGDPALPKAELVTTTTDATTGQVLVDHVITDPSEIPDAVRVVATGAVGFAFGGITGVSSGAAARAAIASNHESGCFKIGSFAIGLNTNASILKALLGNAAALRVASYSGVATASVSLLGLSTQLGAATPEDLVNLPGLSVGQFLLASAQVAHDSGDETASVFIAGLAADLPAIAKAAPINLADQIVLGQGNGSALDAQLDVLNLVGGALFLADGDHSLGLSLGLPNVADVALGVTQPPQMGCNEGEASTGQVSLAATISVLGLIKVRVKVGLAEASGRLASVTCAAGTPTSLGVSVYNQKLANVKVSLSVLSGTPPDPVLTQAPAAAQVYPLPLDGSYTTPVTTAPGDIGLSATELSVGLLGLNLGPIVNGLLTPVLLPAVDGLLSSLLGVLGVETAGADLFAVRTPTCPAPHLEG